MDNTTEDPAAKYADELCDVCRRVCWECICQEDRMTPDEARAREVLLPQDCYCDPEFTCMPHLDIAAALRAQRSRWSKEKPTKPGWYWYRHPKWEDVAPVIVNVVIIPQTNVLTILWTAHNEAVSAYRGTGEWAHVLLPEEGA